MTQRSALEFSDYAGLLDASFMNALHLITGKSSRSAGFERKKLHLHWSRICLFGLSSFAGSPHPVCPGLSHLLVSSTRRIILLSGLPWMVWWLPSIVLSALRTPYWHLITMANLTIRLTRAERSMLKLVMFICSLRFSLSTLSNPGLPRAPFCLYDGAPDCAISSWLLVATSRIKWQLV